MTIPKLLPCPHCGSEAQLELFDPPPQAIWSISCKNYCSFDPCGRRADVIAHWNRRAGQSHADAGLLEALEGMLYAVCHETGFAAAVRHDSGKAYPWAPLEIAEERARAAIAAVKGAKP